MNRRKSSLLPLVCLFCVLLVLSVSGCEPLAAPIRTLRVYSPLYTGNQNDRQIGAHDFPAGRPADFKEFKDRYQSIGTSPEGAVRMYFDALYSYIDPARKAEGAKMLRYSLHEKRNWEGSAALATFVSRLKNPSLHYIFRSFAEGTSPEDNYTMDPDDYQLVFAHSRQETDYIAIYIRSSGADSPRPLHAQQFEDGLWYITNNHGTYSDVRTPAGQIRRGGHDADQD